MRNDSDVECNTSSRPKLRPNSRSTSRPQTNTRKRRREETPLRTQDKRIRVADVQHHSRENVKQSTVSTAAQPVRRGRPPSSHKNQKQSVRTSPAHNHIATRNNHIVRGATSRQYSTSTSIPSAGTSTGRHNTPSSDDSQSGSESGSSSTTDSRSGSESSSGSGSSSASGSGSGSSSGSGNRSHRLGHSSSSSGSGSSSSSEADSDSNTGESLRSPPKNKTLSATRKPGRLKTSVERGQCAANELSTTVIVGSKLPYSLDSLTWDKQHRINIEKKYCYCGQDRSEEDMLLCDKCHQWFHQKCVDTQAQEKKIPGDWGYSFVCRICGGGFEIFKRNYLAWPHILEIALFNLGLQDKARRELFFNLETEVFPWVMNHWDPLCFKQNRTSWQHHAQSYISLSEDFEFDSDHSKIALCDKQNPCLKHDSPNKHSTESSTACEPSRKSGQINSRGNTSGLPIDHNLIQSDTLESQPLVHNTTKTPHQEQELLQPQLQQQPQHTSSHSHHAPVSKTTSEFIQFESSAEKGAVTAASNIRHHHKSHTHHTKLSTQSLDMVPKTPTQYCTPFFFRLRNLLLDSLDTISSPSSQNTPGILVTTSVCDTGQNTPETSHVAAITEPAFQNNEILKEHHIESPPTRPTCHATQAEKQSQSDVTPTSTPTQTSAPTSTSTSLSNTTSPILSAAHQQVSSSQLHENQRFAHTTTITNPKMHPKLSLKQRQPPPIRILPATATHATPLPPMVNALTPLSSTTPLILSPHHS
ncbi:polycomb protein Pcl [Pelomyxa schiedti]|nr:polycomb protein Pcl [Pelomyxa schiedti]